jgi:prepilin-type N-terminal cleavage/methylation domain-containing protein
MSGNFTDVSSRNAGFTMIELVVVMIVLGILSVVVLPRMNSATDFRALAFRDSLASGMRFAQKTATSHRRVVCAAFTSTTMTMTIASGAGTGTACDTNLPLPGSAGNVVTSPDATNVTLAGLPAVLYVQPDGRITTTLAGAIPDNAVVDANVNGQALTIRGSTGYVQ